MDNKPNRNVVTFLLVALFIIGMYLAFFNFNIKQAYDYTVQQVQGTFR